MARPDTAVVWLVTGCASHEAASGSKTAGPVTRDPLTHSLSGTEGSHFELGEPVAYLHLAPASFGAWVVFQSDGGNSLMVPPIVAARIDHLGQAISALDPIPVSPAGFLTNSVAVASLGDTLAVAWVDSVDPSAPTIVVQLVEPSGILGAGISIPTNDASLSGQIEMLASPDGNSLLLAWEGQVDGPRVALARVDCAGGA